MNESPIPYSRQSIDQDDIDAVVAVLRGRWLTTGPAVDEFQAAVADFVGCRQGVAFSSGTAALHGMLNALEIRPGDEVIVPAITFVATANAVLYQGGTPIFADVQPENLLIDPADVQRKITANTRAILAVDYAGQPCDYPALRRLATQHGLALLADASHSLGARLQDRSVAQWADMTAFSFHPVKPITTGEGGMVMTDQDGWARQLMNFRGHGIDVDFRQRAQRMDWRYQMESLGFNYRMSDLQAALGLSQLRKIGCLAAARREIAATYQRRLEPWSSWLVPLEQNPTAESAHHLFVIRWLIDSPSFSRDWLFARLRAAGIAVNVHYQPVYQHPYYQQSVPSARRPQCPVADQVIDQVLSLPIFPGMSDAQIRWVCHCLEESLREVRLTAAA